MQNQASLIFKIALNRILTLAFDRARRVMPESSGIIDLQNNHVCKQFKHWKYRISVPMLYIAVIYCLVFWKRFDLRRVTAILLQQKNLGPNVVYCGLGKEKKFTEPRFRANLVFGLCQSGSGRTSFSESTVLINSLIPLLAGVGYTKCTKSSLNYTKSSLNYTKSSLNYTKSPLNYTKLH